MCGPVQLPLQRCPPFCAALCVWPSLQAKLADFGLHKRVRKMASSGALVAWNQETTYHGGDFDKSYYGGKLYLVKSAMSIASSAPDDDSMYNGSMHGNGSSRGGSLHGGSSWHRAAAAGTALSPTAAADMPASGQHAASRPGKPPLPYRSASSAPLAQAGAAGNGLQSDAPGGVQCSDSAGSIFDRELPGAAGKDKQQELLQGAVRAKSQGLLAKQDFVTRVLAVSSSSNALNKVGVCVAPC